MILEKEMQQMENALAHFNKKNESISKSGVDWHIDHNLRVIYTVCKTLQQSNEKDYKWSFNLTKSYLFLKGSFPKGRAKAPKAVVSKSEIIKEVIEGRLKTTRVLLKEIENLPKRSHFKHPVFGVLNLKESKTLLKIHTKHHLKIIDKIISSPS